MAIGYKYKYRKVLGFISTGGAGSTDPGDPYLSCFLDIFSNVSVCPDVRTHFLGGYLNACNLIENHNRVWNSILDIDKYWVTHSGYFRLANKVSFGMGITDGKLLFFHGVLEEIVDKKFSMIE